jgi:hypothetical protein
MIIIENITVSQYQNINKDIGNTQHSLYEGEGGGREGVCAYYLKAERVFTIDYCHVFVFITNTFFIGE